MSDMDFSEVLDKFTGTVAGMEKSSEGVMLALGAQLQLLKKMDDREAKREGEFLRKQQEEIEAQRQVQQKLEKQQEINAMIESITKGVLQKLAAYPSIEGKAKKVESKDKWPIPNAGTPDPQVAAKLDTDTGKVQMPLQAMQKHDTTMMSSPYQKNMTGNEKEVPDTDVDMEEKENGMSMDERGATDYPKEETNDEELDNETNPAIKMLKQEINNLRKMQKQMETNLDELAKNKADSIMKERGWNKEISRTPRLVKNGKILGVNDSTPIQKAQTPDQIVDQLAELSWNKLSEMRLQKIMGITDGLPREVIDNSA